MSLSESLRGNGSWRSSHRRQQFESSPPHKHGNGQCEKSDGHAGHISTPGGSTGATLLFIRLHGLRRDEWQGKRRNRRHGRLFQRRGGSSSRFSDRDVELPPARLTASSQNAWRCLGRGSWWVRRAMAAAAAAIPPDGDPAAARVSLSRSITSRRDHGQVDGREPRHKRSTTHYRNPPAGNARVHLIHKSLAAHDAEPGHVARARRRAIQLGR